MLRILSIILLLPVLASAQPGAMHHMLMAKATVVDPYVYQAETNQFFDSLTAHSTSWTVAQKKNVDTLMRDIKGLSNPNYTTYNIKDSFYRIYPVFSGTSYGHSLDLLNAANAKLIFYGSPTHAGGGITFNGSNQYAEVPFELDSSNWAWNNRGATIFTRNRSSSNGYLFGSYNGAASVWGIRQADATNLFLIGMNDIQFPSAIPMADMMDINRSSVSSAALYNNGTSVFTTTDNRTTNTGNLYIGAVNNVGSPALYLQFDLLLFAFHKSLDATRQTFWYQAVNAYQNRLSR
ncbi:MAG: hypothetical protein QM743_08705 [Chitinophagaceae bacterium]